MSEWYKFEPLAWDRGTDNLTLEQEAAFLRVCNAIYASDQPIAENYRVLGGLWRCNERKSKRLLSELIEAGKLTVVDGLIHNERAVYDVSIRRELRVKRQLAGVRGGIESGKSRAKALKNNDTGQASGSTREEKKREEKTTQKAFDIFWAAYPKSVRKSGKVDAKIAFTKIIKGNHSKQEKTAAEEIIKGVEAYSRFVDPQFIKAPTAWLNAGMWEVDAPSQSEMQMHGTRSKTDMYRGMK